MCKLKLQFVRKKDGYGLPGFLPLVMYRERKGGLKRGGPERGLGFVKRSQVRWDEADVEVLLYVFAWQGHSTSSAARGRSRFQSFCSPQREHTTAFKVLRGDNRGLQKLRVQGVGRRKGRVEQTRRGA